jgi:hypothetical protein
MDGKNSKNILVTRIQAPNFVMIRIWGRFRDCIVVALRDLINLDDMLRDSPALAKAMITANP